MREIIGLKWRQNRTVTSPGHVWHGSVATKNLLKNGAGTCDREAWRTVGKQKAFLARGPVKGNRVCATAKRRVRAESVVKKMIKVVEIELDESDDENGGVEREWGTFVVSGKCGSSNESCGSRRAGARCGEDVELEKRDAVRYQDS
ncbi:hypothetical protein KFL_016200010 [Klebsormidium nitens]|uniref:Uncharacterized protein n=1 Tax=Klebsormidium nitens TaxID=105231 RepID=A0A1Y1IV75_KLENI|nr:hypothetical protein KFL_016200010 [Klebsormidium nitens]|eukprot:GAQ93529.1 hypothetical protein KFL_016200010 [Klebsormidium nitens]